MWGCLLEVCALSPFFLFKATHLTAVIAELTVYILSGSYSIMTSIIIFLLYSKIMCVLLLLFTIFIKKKVTDRPSQVLLSKLC